MDHSGRAVVFLYRLLSLDELERVRGAIVEGFGWFVGADAVGLWERTDAGYVETARHGRPLAGDALELEQRLVELPGPSQSTLDRHADPRLQQLSAAYRSSGSLCQMRPLRAFGTRVGAVVFHVSRRSELTLGEITALRSFSDAAGVALQGAYQREELRRLAYTDALTGLPNRRRIDEILDEQRQRRPAVLFVDFDGLKGVNNLVSYEVGDRVIQAIGEALQTVARNDLVPGRLGGDEFVVVAVGADEARLREEADALTETLAAVDVPDEAKPHFRGASVGAAIAADGEDPAQLLRRAAAEMRAVKAARRRARQEPTP